MNYFNQFTNPNKDEKEYRDAEFRVCRIRAEIDDVERDIKRNRDRIKRLKQSLDELL